MVRSLEACSEGMRPRTSFTMAERSTQAPFQSASSAAGISKMNGKGSDTMDDLGHSCLLGILMVLQLPVQSTLSGSLLCCSRPARFGSRILAISHATRWWLRSSAKPKLCDAIILSSSFQDPHQNDRRSWYSTMFNTTPQGHEHVVRAADIAKRHAPRSQGRLAPVSQTQNSSESANGLCTCARGRTFDTGKAGSVSIT